MFICMSLGETYCLHQPLCLDIADGLACAINTSMTEWKLQQTQLNEKANTCVVKAEVSSLYSTTLILAATPALGTHIRSMMKKRFVWHKYRELSFWRLELKTLKMSNAEAGEHSSSSVISSKIQEHKKNIEIYPLNDGRLMWNNTWDVKFSEKNTPDNIKTHNIKTLGKTVSACQDRNAERKITSFTPLRDRKLHTPDNTVSTRQQNTPTWSSQKSAKSW